MLEDPFTRPRRIRRCSAGSCEIDVSAACHLAPLLWIRSWIVASSSGDARTDELKKERKKRPDRSAKRLWSHLIFVLYITIFLFIQIARDSMLSLKDMVSPFFEGPYH
jgi:hypothetical protein